MGCANSTPAVTEEVGHPEKVVAALQTLRDSLSHLTPAGQTTVKQSHAFASAEWLDGMAALTETTVNKGKETSISREASVHAGHQGAFQEARIKLTPDSSKLILVLVGLPARGKSLLGYKLESYLNWRGWRTRTFRVGELRRDQAAPVNDSSPTARPSSGAASFFDNRKAFAKLTREAVAEEAFAKLLTWLDTGGQIAIFDATNCTAARRAKLNELVKAHSAAHGAGAKEIGVVYIESIVTDPATIMAGMRWKIKHSPDFKGMDETEAMKDLVTRVGHYESVYETVTEAEGAYIKMFDLRAKVHACNIFGRMATKVLPFLLGLHSVPRPVFLVTVSAGNDQASVADAEQLQRAASWVKDLPHVKDLQIFCSRTARGKEMASALAEAGGCENKPQVRIALNPFDAAVDASPLAQRRAAGSNDSFRAESLERLTPEVVLASRLEPFAVEIEAATSPCLIITHAAPCASIRALMLGLATKTEEDLSGRVDEDTTVHNAMNSGMGMNGTVALGDVSLAEGGSAAAGGVLDGNVKYEQMFSLNGGDYTSPIVTTIIELQPRSQGGFTETIHELPPAK